MVLEPILGLLASVFRIIILLEDDGTGGLVIKYKAALQATLHNLDVKVPTHPPINLAGISNPLPQHTASNHQRASSKLQGSFHKSITNTLSCLFPHLFPVSCYLNPSD